jgi:diguanylate cyclase (GGDEF)-like protein/PAS domain S-box-containing protein
LFNRILSSLCKHFTYFHPSHSPSLGKAIFFTGLMAAGLVTAIFLQPLLKNGGWQDYLPLHTALETFAIIIAALIFAVGWSGKDSKLPGNIVLLAAVFMGVGILDFSHLLSYPGMPDYVTPSSADKMIDFWLAARILSTVGLFLFVLLPMRPFTFKFPRYLILAIVLIITGIVHWLVLIVPDLVPHIFFIEGKGLTALKINTENIIIGLTLITALLLLRRMHQPQNYHASSLFAGLCITAMSEFFFTLYADVTDIYNISGHLYKVIAYLFIYRAIFITVIATPYHNLDLAKTELSEKNRLLDDIIENIPSVIVIKNIKDLRFVLVNKSTEKLIGLSRENILGKNDYDIFPKEQADFFTAKDRETIQKRKLLEIPEEAMDTPLGTRTLFTKKITMVDENNNPSFLLSISEDITELNADRKALEESERSLRESQRIARLGSYLFDLRNDTWVSSEILNNLLGIDADYQRTMEGWKQLIHPDERSRIDYYWQENVFNQKKPFDQEYRIKPKNYQADRWVHCLGELELDDQGTPILMKGTIQDITERKLAETHLDNLANFDQLTGLPNRFMLKDKIRYLFTLARREKESLTMMFLNLDHFKNINDTLGHAIGDQLLIEIAKRLKSTIREVDLVSRIGSDEYILLFPNTDVDRAINIATKLIETVSRPAIFEHQELFITPTIGIAIYPNDGEEFETLIKNADTAMSLAKKYSRNTFHFFTEEMQVHLERKLKIVDAMRHALRRNEMQVHYQPQISAVDGQTIGAEALLRWSHPELGDISPGEFIPIAESCGQIITIGEWVLRTVIAQMKAWQDKGLAPMIVAVNLSALQFKQDNLLGMIIGMLDEAQLAHEYLELELTEASTIDDPQQAINIMNQFHAQGIRMSIDDFGTGYSSLSYLKQFKVYKLKIDQSFISNLAKDSDDRAMVQAIIDMAKNLGMHTIAEGVETLEQLEFLRLHGCNEIQGYHFSKAIPADEFARFAKQDPHR